MLLILFVFQNDHSIHFSLDDVGAERAIERSIREVREQIDKGAADCKYLTFLPYVLTIIVYLIIIRYFFNSAPPDRPGNYQNYLYVG